ncbi:MAG: AI-2E family transporter [Ignavibacteria bacterium]|nr:AI-2E family transporter [Ignavibacteria bacterium]
MESKDNIRLLNITAALLLTGFSVYVLKELSSILIPFVLAVFISFAFEPFYMWLKSKKIPSGIAIALILLIIIIMANIAGAFIVAGIDSFSSGFNEYEKKFIELFNSVVNSLNLKENDRVSLNEFLKISNLLKQGSITSLLGNFFTSIVGIFSDFVIILFYVIFILSELSGIKERIVSAFPGNNSKKITDTLDRVFKDVRKYISGKTIISLALGLISGIILWIFGVDFYFIWGFLIFIMHFIPSFGALIAITFPSVVMFLQFDGIVKPVIVTSLLILLQNLIGNIVEPKVLGGRLNLSPLLLLFSLFIGGYIWGIIGMVLSVPVMSMIKIILMNFDSTKPIAVLMSYKSDKK